jgi:hypothetical protein
MPPGRPSIPFNPELATEICDRLSCSDKALSEVLDELGNPISEWMFYKWQRENEDFAKESAHARDSQGFYLADKAIIESRTSRIGQVSKVGPKGEEITVSDNVERSKLIVQTYFKRAGQLNKALSEKIQAEHTGPDGGAIQIVSTIPRPPKE